MRGSGAEPASAAVALDLTAPVTMAAENVTIDVMFRVTQGLTGIKIQADPELVQAWRAARSNQQFRITATCDKLEAKYLIAWLAQFGDAKAMIRDGVVHLVPRSSKEEGDPVFDCFEEADGTWRDTLIRDINGLDPAEFWRRYDAGEFREEKDAEPTAGDGKITPPRPGDVYDAY